MANKRWFHVPVSVVPEALAPCEARNDQGAPNRNLSVVWNRAQTEAVVKVDGADRDWRAGQAWIVQAINVFDWDTIETLREMLCAEAWAVVEDE